MFTDGAETLTWLCAGILTLWPRPQRHPPIRGHIRNGEESKRAESCMTNLFPAGGVTVLSVIGRLLRLVLLIWSSIHPLSCAETTSKYYQNLIRPVWVEPLVHFIWCHDAPVGRAADQRPVVFLVRTLKLMMSLLINGWSSRWECWFKKGAELKLRLWFTIKIQTVFLDDLHWYLFGCSCFLSKECNNAYECYSAFGLEV